MKKRDIQMDDITYANGFPANICMSSCIVVQITSHTQSVVLYTCKARGTPTRSYLGKEFGEIYTNDIHIFGV
jgi:hypothetical protein